LRYCQQLSATGILAKLRLVTQPALSIRIQVGGGVGVPLVERRPAIALTDIGAEWRCAPSAYSPRPATSPIAHRGRLLTGRMQLGVIP
jgi:hypothetical protein